MARFNTRFLKQVWDEDAQDYKQRWVELKAFSLNKAVKEFNKGISSRRFVGDEPFVFTMSMSEIKEDIGGTYVFNSRQEKLSAKLARDVLKIVTDPAYPYTPIKNYNEMFRKASENKLSMTPEQIVNHKHLYENVTLAKVKQGAVPRYGLNYRAEAMHGDPPYLYGARQYYGEEFDDKKWKRDTSIHSQARGRWLEPLSNPAYSEHEQFINKERRYVEREAVKLAKAAMRGKVK